MNHGRRGAALPETALVLTLLLSVLVGALRIGIVGYEQVSADGAAFYNAHENGVKQTYPGGATGVDPLGATHTAFPRSASSTIASGTYAPPSVQVPTNYGLTATDDRRGGTSLIQPQQTVSTVTRTGLDSLSLFGGGSLLSVQGIGVDASYKENGVHGGIAGADPNSPAAFTGSNDYFTQGENTPPYFGGFHYLRFCAVNNKTTTWNGCPTASSFLALGMAEYLDQDNWGRSVNGVLPAQTAVFWETLYHEQVYAAITAALPQTISGTVSNAAQPVLDHLTGATHAVYCWDSAQQGGFPAPGYVPGTYPLQPGLQSC